MCALSQRRGEEIMSLNTAASRTCLAEGRFRDQLCGPVIDLR